MGQKRKYKQKNRGKKRTHYSPKQDPLTEDEKIQLEIEASEGIPLLKKSKEAMVEKKEKVGYILSKQWYETWKQHVGYDAVVKGEQPSGRKYGRNKPKELNEDLVDSSGNYHEVPDASYEVLSQPLKKELVPGRDYMIVNEEAWRYFHELYGGFAIVRTLNQQGDFDLRFLRPHVIFLNEEQLSLIHEGQNALNALDHRRLQVMASWTFEEFLMYLQLFGFKQEVRVWQLDGYLDAGQLKAGLLKSIQTKKFAVKGDLLERNPDEVLKNFVKSAYTYLVEERQFQFKKSEVPFSLGSVGLCEYCSTSQALSKACVCSRKFYCSNRCRYADQKFHFNSCPLAYDSDDDEDMDKIQDLSHSRNNGLVNLGNTCYMNSAIQAIISSPNFQKFILARTYFKGTKKDLRLCYKFEKLLKHLLTGEQTFHPGGFRQQFSQFHPAFGENYQQDSAEFLFYLFDAMNEEITQKGQKEVVEEKEVEVVEEKEEDDDEDDEDDEEEEKKEEQRKLANFEEYKQKQKAFQQGDSDCNDPNAIWQKYSEATSQLIVANFSGLLRSNILCPKCNKTTTNYEPFTLLPLSLDCKPKDPSFIEVQLVYLDWNRPCQKLQLPFLANQTMLATLKLELSKQVGIEMTKLIGAIATQSYINKFLFHEEDIIEKCAQQALEEDGKFLVFYEMDVDLTEMKDTDVYCGVELHCMRKRNEFQTFKEDVTCSFPRMIVLRGEHSLEEVYKKCFASLGANSRKEDILDFIIEEEKEDLEEELLKKEEIVQKLGYEVRIQFKLPAKKRCPFECKRQFKKEQGEHTCYLYFNKQKLQHYLDAINYNFSFLSLIIDWGENDPPFQGQFHETAKLSKKGSNLQLDDLLQNFEKPEILTNENAYYCMNCYDLCEAEKVLKIDRLPSQLILQLKRFHYDEYKATYQKNNTTVNYAEAIEINHVKFELYGVVLHYGSLNNGHYIGLGKRKGEWFEFNDEKVTQVAMKEVLNNKSAYLLFYEAT